MNHPAEQHPVPNLTQAPVPSLLVEPRAPTPAPYGHEIDLKAWLHTLFDSRWLITAITLLVTFVALVYALVAEPVYEADMVIHVEEESPNATKNILSEASSLFETKKAPIAEIELLRSRMVVSHAVDNLRLYIEVRPKYFPIVGFWFAGRGVQRLSEPGIFGRGGYVWGSEKAEVSHFEVPKAWENRIFQITALGDGRFSLRGEGGLDAKGTVGTVLKAGTGGGELELRVDSLAAKPGAQFMIRRVARVAAIESIQRAMQISEQGKQSGVIEVKLQGASAQRVNNVLSELGREYLRQDLARKTEEAEKSLAFLNQQLPLLKHKLEQSEERYNQFRNAHSSVDLQEEAKISLQQAAAARTRRIELMQKKTELLSRFTVDHPVLLGVERQRKEVEAELDEVALRIKALPVLEQDEARLTREIKVNTDLYTALSNTAQQLRLISVSKVSNVRMIDAPVVPVKPIKPNRALIVALAVITGLFLGTLIAFARKAISGGIDDAQEIERMLGAPVVYATIPHSSNQDRLMRRAKRMAPRLPLLAQAVPEDIAIESLRSFRAALQFSMPHFRNNIVMLAGPAGGLGKSFVSANLAAVMAASGMRVLLIDADLRNGHLHRYFGVSHEQGLSRAIAGTMPVEHIIHRSVLENLDFIPTGALPPNRAEFLLHLNLGTLLETVSASYDLVLIDAPPLLAVADALIIGAHAGAVFILARARATSEGQINEAIKRLNQAGIYPQGVLFNDSTQRLGAYDDLCQQASSAKLGYST